MPVSEAQYGYQPDKLAGIAVATETLYLLLIPGPLFVLLT